MKTGTKPTYGFALAELDKYLGVMKAAGAQEKAAAETSEDSTTHPIQGVDEQLKSISEGARSAENEADITKAIGPQNVNDAAPAKDEEPKPVAMTTAATTGEDSSNETGGVKLTKDDPGTSHPAKAGGEKGAAYLEQVKKACVQFGAEKVATELGNSILADIATFSNPAVATEKAAEAGAAAADAALDQTINDQLPALVAEVVKQAELDAKNVAEFYVGRVQRMKKADEDDKKPEEAVSGEDDDDKAPGDAGEEGALPVEDLAQLAAAAGPAAGPAAAGPAAAAPMGAAGEPSDEEVLSALSEALADAGITPEELAAAVADQEATGVAPVEQKMAALNIANLAVSEVNRYRNLQAAGRLPNVKRASIQLTYIVRQMIKDVVGR